jgi:hypothetical protein
MARGREGYNPLLKSYPDSDSINAVSEGAEVLYVRLIAATDDASHYYGDPYWILSRLFTARMITGQLTTDDIAGRLRELAQVGLLRIYAVRNVEYLELVNCFKKVRGDVKPDIRFPAPPQEGGDSGVVSAQPTAIEDSRAEFDTDTARIRNGFVPSTRPNPTQPKPNNQPNRARGSVFGKITADDLRDDDRLAAWFAKACAAKNPIVSELDRLNVWGAAERALEHGESPPALFTSIVQKRDWKLITEAQGDRADKRLKRCRFPPLPTPIATALADSLKPKTVFHEPEPPPPES